VAKPVDGNRGNGVTVRITLGDERPAPPAEITPLSVKLGSVLSKNVFRDSQTVTATFVLPAGMPAGAVDATVTFSAPSDWTGNLVFAGTGAFTMR